ncbi:hypothetical protein D9M69_598110 [compost metagenome]
MGNGVIFSVCQTDPDHKKVSAGKRQDQHRDQEDTPAYYVKVLSEEILVDFSKEVSQALLAFGNKDDPGKGDQEEQKGNHPDNDPSRLFQEE